MVVADDERTVIGSSGRVRTEFRKHGLFIFGAIALQKVLGANYPHIDQVLGVTRSDEVILAPRYFGEFQINKLIGTNVRYDYAFLFVLVHTEYVHTHTVTYSRPPEHYASRSNSHIERSAVVELFAIKRGLIEICLDAYPKRGESSSGSGSGFISQTSNDGITGKII